MDRPREDALRTGPRPSARRQVRGPRGRVAVVGRRCPDALEEGAAVAVGGQIARPGRGVLAGDLAEARRRSRGSPRTPGSTTGSGPIGGHDPARTSRSRGSSGAMSARRAALSVVAITSMLNRSNKARGRNSGVARRVGDRVVVRVGVVGAERSLDAEQRREGVVEPEPRRRAAEQVVVLGEAPPDLARVASRPAPPSRRGTPRSSSGTPWV